MTGPGALYALKHMMYVVLLGLSFSFFAENQFFYFQENRDSREILMPVVSIVA